MTLERIASKVISSATLTAMLAGILIGAPFRCCMAEESREHGPPPTILSASISDSTDLLSTVSSVSPSPLAVSALRIALSHPSAIHTVPAGIEVRHALVQRIVTHSLFGVREHYVFEAALKTASREERQREHVAIQLGRAVSRRGDSGTAARIENIYRSLQIARWGRHADGLLGGHFNFDYSAVRCVDLDRRLPRGRYGQFASLHFHHEDDRVHVDAANPFGMAGALVPAHFFLDVVAGHLSWLRRR